MNKKVSDHNKRGQIYQIDQSGKVEQTQIDTIVALANGTDGSVLCKTQTKRILQEVFRRQKRAKLFPYLTFAALVAILIKICAPKRKVIIDTEYYGHNNLIRERIIAYLRLLGQQNMMPIEFGYVGKNSPAHTLAAHVGNKKRKPTKKVTLEEILKLLFAIKKDRESKRAEGNLTQDWLPGDQKPSRSQKSLSKKQPFVKEGQKKNKP